MYHLKIWSSGIKSLAISTLSNLRETSSSPSLHSDRFLNCARSSISLHVPVWCKFISHVFNLKPPPQKRMLLVKAGNKSNSQVCNYCWCVLFCEETTAYQFKIYLIFSKNCHLKKKLQHWFLFFFCRFRVVTRKADGGQGKKGVTTKFLRYWLSPPRKQRAGYIDTIKTLLMWRFITKVSRNTMQLTSGCWSEDE